MRATIVAAWLAVTIVACASTPEQKELRRYCRAGGYVSDARCKVPRHEDLTGKVPVCDDWGRCTWVDRNDLMREIRVESANH